MATEVEVDDLKTRTMDITTGLLSITLGLTVEGRKPEPDRRAVYDLARSAQELADEFITWHEAQKVPLLEVKARRSMDIYAKSGAKVRFSFPKSGYTSDQNQTAKYLKVDTVYTVSWTDVGRGSTLIGLLEVPEQSFNSVMFSDVKEPHVE